jgi:hypothetical protein
MDARLVGLKEYVLDLLEMPLRIKEMVILMADQSVVLNDVAEKLRGPLASSVQALIQENADLRRSNAELSGEDVQESAATENVVSAFNEVSNLFEPAELPDVPPLEGNDGGVNDNNA